MRPQAVSYRRCFQISLRQMLIAVAVLGMLGGWIGSMAWTVHSRRTALLDRIERKRGMYRFAQDEANGQQPQPSMPWLRRAMGDRAVVEIDLDYRTNLVERHQIEKLFPEANILAVRYADDGEQCSACEPNPKLAPNYFPFPDG